MELLCIPVTYPLLNTDVFLLLHQGDGPCSYDGSEVISQITVNNNVARDSTGAEDGSAACDQQGGTHCYSLGVFRGGFHLQECVRAMEMECRLYHGDVVPVGTGHYRDTVSENTHSRRSTRRRCIRSFTQTSALRKSGKIMLRQATNAVWRSYSSSTCSGMRRSTSLLIVVIEERGESFVDRAHQ